MYQQAAVQMHLGEEPWEYRSKVLATTPSLCYGRAQLLRQSEQALRIELLIFKYPGACRQEAVYPPGLVLARRCQHRSLDRPGEGPALSPVVALPGEPCRVMGPRGRECSAVSPKSLLEDCDGTYGEKFLHTSLHFL